MFLIGAIVVKKKTMTVLDDDCICVRWLLHHPTHRTMYWEDNYTQAAGAWVFDPSTRYQLAWSRGCCSIRADGQNFAGSSGKAFGSLTPLTPPCTGYQVRCAL